VPFLPCRVHTICGSREGVPMFNLRWKARHVAPAFQPMLAPVTLETVSAGPAAGV
jgi:hypothetical protein